jgi:hypothetical protein
MYLKLNKKMTYQSDSFQEKFLDDLIQKAWFSKKTVPRKACQAGQEEFFCKADLDSNFEDGLPTCFHEKNCG